MTGFQEDYERLTRKECNDLAICNTVSNFTGKQQNLFQGGGLQSKVKMAVSKKGRLEKGR